MEQQKLQKRTFIIQVSSCEHASWQGTINWVDGKKTVPFRSALEMIRLMDSVISQNQDESLKQESFRGTDYPV